jgi:aminopeptidase N
MLWLGSLYFSANAQLYDVNNSNVDTCEILQGALRIERTCFDVTYYRLDLEVDITEQSLYGSNLIRFEVKEATQKIQLDLHEDLSLDAIIWHNRKLVYTRVCKAIFIDFPESLKPGSIDSLKVHYQGRPVDAPMAPWYGGFVWAADESARPWVGVACQGMGASTWWPCKDHLTDEPDSMDILITVPDTLYAVSNGIERASTNMPMDQKRYHWHISYPINTYNVTLNIADYDHWSDQYVSADGDSLPLDYYVLKSHRKASEKQFAQVKPMLSCYEKYLGKYPFYRDGYALVETPYLGMEHQGAIAYGNKYKKGYLGDDRSGCKLDFDYIIIHETGHEWWGNSVSAGDIADMWIHEGFCTYTEAIYVEHFFGYDTAMIYVNSLKRSVANISPIIGTYGINREGHGDMYVKGMLFLNTLRHVVNDDERWWQTVKYVSDTLFRMRVTNYQEVVDAFNRFEGVDVPAIFEQYVKRTAIPVLEYDILTKRKDRILRYRWSAVHDGFSMPLDIQVGEKVVRIFPQTEWQEMPLSGNLKWNENTFYVRYKKSAGATQSVHRK